MHQLLIDPLTSTSLEWPSVHVNQFARPLDEAMLPCFLDRDAPGDSDQRDPRLDLMSADVNQTPPATVITAEIDPLRSQGLAFAERLEQVGMDGAVRVDRGVTHEFLGMTAALETAREAQAFACARLREAFACRRAALTRERGDHPREGTRAMKIAAFSRGPSWL